MKIIEKLSFQYGIKKQKLKLKTSFYQKIKSFNVNIV